MKLLFVSALCLLFATCFCASLQADTTKYWCTLPMKVGPCRAAVPKFYYDSSTGRCKMFIYGGCQGNANRFNTQKDCMQVCSGEKTKRPRKEVPRKNATTLSTAKTTTTRAC
uniref:Kunitz domain n=1 Tax=Argas monolakensis TaxID=34602 RepID=Q09JS6_ARGMO|nr:Kunitz domain [Argas monolakensis]